MKLATSSFSMLRFGALLLVALSTAGRSEASDCVAPPSGLVGFWTADNQALDWSGNSHHGQASGISYSTGKVQSAFHFDGASSSIRISPAPELAVNSLTLAAWIRPSDGVYRPILMYQRDHAYEGVLLWTGQYGEAHTAGSLYANVRGGVGHERVVYAPGAIRTNEWSFVAVTYDAGTGITKLYVNAEIRAETTNAVSGYGGGILSPDTSGPLYIGRSPETSLDIFRDRSFHGDIDEAMVVARALTAAELNQIYAAGAEGVCRREPVPPSFSAFDPVLLATNDLVAVYPLNGSANDTSGRGLNGTLFGTRSVPDRFGRTNSALYFNGTNDYVDLGNRLEFNFTDGFTLNAWVKPDGGANAYVLGKYSYQSAAAYQSHSYGLGVHEGLGSYGFVAGEGPYYDILGGPSLNDGQWHVITLTYENDTGVRLYADGQLKGTRSTGSLPPFTNSLPLLIGKIASGLGFIGAIDDVSIYKRALDAEEVSLLHHFQRFSSVEMPVLLQQPTATISQSDWAGDYSVGHIADNIIDNFGWAIGPAITNQTAVVETVSNVGFAGGTVLKFKLVFAHNSFGEPSRGSALTLGRFRLSATTDARDSFADSLPNGGDVSANWLDLTILSATASSGATLTLLPDNSILVSGVAPEFDTYTVTAATRLTAITGLRLEALTHPSLPFNGPGREPINGNFVVSELIVAARPGGAPLITNQPASITVTYGGSATFSVSATSSLPVTYQWFRNGVAVSGATNSSLNIANVDFSDAGTYTVQLENTEGVVLSSGAVLDVVPPNDSSLATVLVSNFEPTNAPISDIAQNLLAGAAYLAQAYGGPTADSLLAQGPAVPFLTGENAGFFTPIRLVLTNVVRGSNAFVQIRVWETAAGSTFEQAVQRGGQHGSSATLQTSTGGGRIPIPQLQGLTPFSLVAAPRIQLQPVSQTVYVGQEAFFQIRALGSAPLFYEWFLNNTRITTGTGADLVLTNLQVEQSGEIYAIVRNSVGATTSTVARLTVLTPDITAPRISVSSPTPGATFATHVTLSGSITDDRGVASASWTLNNQAGGEITLQDGQFNITNIALVRGTNIFRVTATDTSSNTTTVQVTVTNMASRAVYVGELPPHQEGAYVRVPLFIESRGDIGGVDFVLGYDRISFADAEVVWDEVLQGAVTQASTNLNSILGSFALSGTTLPTGTVQFATVVFRSRSVPTARTLPIPLNVTGLYDAKGDPLAAVGTDVRSGRVQITVRDFVGDNNANDRLDIGDASIIMRLANRVEVPRSWDIAKNDLNRNFQLDAGDVIRVLRAVVGLDPQPSLPGGQGQGLAAAGLRSAAAGAGNVTLQFDKQTAAPGEQVKLTVNLSQLSKPLDAAAFRLNYPTSALKLQNSSAHRVGAIVPTSAAVLWNVFPAQNDYEAQNGTVSLAVSSDRPWQTNQGVLAEFTFTVQPGATNQHQWALGLQSEFSSGYELLSAPASEAAFTGREALPPKFDSTPALTDEGISLSFAAEAGLRYRVEVSEDLKTWTLLTTLESTGSVLNYTDPIAAPATRRFYRAIQVE